LTKPLTTRGNAPQGRSLLNSPAPAIAGALTQIATADFNADGTADLLRQAGNSDPYVLDGASGVQQAVTQSTYGLTFLAAADLNGDGRADIILQDTSGNLID
jgi:hypothetical protein